MSKDGEVETISGEEVTRAVARALRMLLPEDISFCLMLYDGERPDQAAIVSDDADVRLPELLRVMADRVEEVLGERVEH